MLVVYGRHAVRTSSGVHMRCKLMAAEILMSMRHKIALHHALKAHIQTFQPCKAGCGVDFGIKVGQNCMKAVCRDPVMRSK